MKIEKINDNQIRCTLTRDDLAQRQLKLSELAYGSEKAKSLFREMMQQAASEFGFESDNLPLMIEAIPTAGDSIVLNITKVDDPDELDTRFSRFTPTPADEAADKHKSVLEHLKKLDGAEDFLDILRQMKEAVSQLPENPEALADTPVHLCSPPLTTVAVDTDAIARLAAKRMIKHMNEPQKKSGEVYRIPGKIIYRDSVCKINGSSDKPEQSGEGGKNLE